MLAENKVGIFVISTYNTDYVLVKEENYEKAVRALRGAGYGVKTQQDLLAGGQTGVAPKKSWLKARWNKICRLMRALDREPYIDDQIEIEEIWKICEEMIASGRLTEEPWELRKSIRGYGSHGGSAGSAVPDAGREACFVRDGAFGGIQCFGREMRAVL